MADPIHPLKLIEPTPDPSLLMDPQTPIWLWISSACLLAVLISLIWIVRRCRNRSGKTTPAPAFSPYRCAKAAMERVSLESTHLCAAQTSLILREYLFHTFHDPALLETHEEFSARPHALQSLPTDLRSSVLASLDRLASDKYAPTLSHRPPHDIVQDALTLLETLHLRKLP